MTQQVIKQDLNPEEGTVIYQEAIQLQFFSQKKTKTKHVNRCHGRLSVSMTNPEPEQTLGAQGK